MGKKIAASNLNIFFCDGGSCQKAGSENVVRTARAYLRNKGHWDTTHTIKTRCNGRCEDAPTCIIQQGDYWYKKLDHQKIIPILESHLQYHKPLKKDLLYQQGWETHQSDNERPEVMPKPFQLKIDAELGSVIITKGFSSDQYLYPLFLFLQSVNEGVSIVFENGERYFFSDFLKVVYETSYTLQLYAKNNRIIDLIIGGVPKSEPSSIIQQKITQTEYFIVKGTTSKPQKGIRFKDKRARTIAIIYIPKTANQTWEYCLSTQLKGIQIKEEAIMAQSGLI